VFAVSKPVPTPTPNEEQKRIQRGAKVTLDTVKRFPGTVTEAATDHVTVTFRGTADLEQQLPQSGANEAHLVCKIAHKASPPEFSVLVYLNAPKASVAGQITAGFVGGLAFFEHPGHGSPPFRLLLTSALKEAPAPAGADITATFVPVTFPGRESVPEVLEIGASLDLMQSTVGPSQ
jgi:hypothetical protein